MVWSRRGSWILAAVVALAWAPAALATTVVPVADADLVSTATAIVIADVKAIESRWDPATRRIFTVITLDVRDSLKGEIPLGPLTIRQLGGRVAGMQAWVEGSPEFTVGERVLVFLSRNADGTLRVAHLYQGKFSIQSDAQTGASHAVRAPGRHVHVLGRGAAAMERRPLADFLRDIRLHVGRGPRGTAAHSQVPPASASGQVTEVQSSFVFLDVPARWFEPDSGVAISMHVNGSEPLAPTSGLGQVRDGFAAWNAVTGSRLRYSDGGATDARGFTFDGVSTISFGDPLGQLDPPTNCSGTLGLGGYFRDDTQTRVVNGQTFSRILEGDVVFNDGWAGCGFYEAYANLAEVATHELGHALGLGHSTNPDATMYAFAHFDGRGAALRDDDRAGVRFAYPAPTLTVQRTGSGTVTSNPAGIDCGSDCSESYAPGTAVTLMAAPAAGSAFGGWSGACSGTGTCSVTLSASTSVTASFVGGLSVAITAHTLAATVTDSGGRTATSSITATVSNGASALRVAMTTPSAGATVSGVVWVTVWVDGATAPSTVTLSVSGTVVKSQTSSSMPMTLDWDSRLTSDGTKTLTVSARDAAGNTGSASLSVTVANGTTPPPPLTARFMSPANGATVSGTVTVGMEVGGASGASNTFRLTIDGTLASTQTVAGTTASFAWNTSALANGSHTLALSASDAAGRTVTATITVTVQNTTSPPPPPPPPPTGGTLNVAMTSPGAGSTVSGVVWVTIWVNGASGASTVTLSAGGTVVKTQTSSSMPVTLDWDSRLTPNGAQTLTASARDATGNTGSASINVTVANSGTPPPPPAPLTVSFTSPANGATVSGTVTVGMAVSGATGSTSFQLAIDGATVSTQTVSGTTAAYTWNTTTIANGNHTLTVSALDGASHSASATITVTVNNQAAPPPPPAGGTLSIAFTAPGEGATVSGTVWMVIWVNGASGSSNTFTVSVGGTLIRTQTTGGANVSIPWDTAGFANGQQTITVTVRDATGNTGSGARSVTAAN
ncbi:MAG: hypothetical protein AUG80_12850 [Candidatus Rokubacteria bacterium 13_1_20CM_4_68_9]|nr:MAG: hypothetical protein AUG80_12850 [Candidatus Rokubacteria bacterium 13_1_20CM_4_68_9]